jgi:hypothetical protein
VSRALSAHNRPSQVLSPFSPFFTAWLCGGDVGGGRTITKVFPGVAGWEMRLGTMAITYRARKI